MDDAVQAFKKMRKSRDTGKATLHELQQLDRQCTVALGKGLSRFVPTYFKDGVRAMAPGCFSPGPGQLLLDVPWEKAPLLRLVSDREGSCSACQTFLSSRLRALEVSDPCHVLWRCAQLGIEHAGYKGAVATLTVAMNAWKGRLGRSSVALAAYCCGPALLWQAFFACPAGRLHFNEHFNESMLYCCLCALRQALVAVNSIDPESFCVPQYTCTPRA